MSMLDLHFPVQGTALPTDHAYALYGAVTQAIPSWHSGEASFMLSHITGEYAGDGQIRLEPKRSRLWLRVPVEEIPTLLTLIGRTLDVAGHPIRLGTPTVKPLVPAPALIARTVTIKGFTEPGPFLDAARRQLNDLGIRGDIGIPLVKEGSRQGEPRRYVLRIKDRRVIGFPLQVTGLTADESIRLQESGLGGRRHLACGFFIPLLSEAA
jgi:CRISPR-associated protein Cas6